MKKNILLFTILAFLVSACSDNWITSLDEKKKPAQIQKKNSIAELKPKHRFSMPLEDVKNEKKLEKELRDITKYPLEDIVEVGEKLMKNYPFEQKANGYKRNMEMIKQDFPNITKGEFIANDSLIMNYYDANLDYEVLQILKKTKTPKKEKKDLKLKVDFPKSYGYGSYGSSNYGYGSYGYYLPSANSNVDCAFYALSGFDKHIFFWDYRSRCEMKYPAYTGYVKGVPCSCVKKEYERRERIARQKRTKELKECRKDPEECHKRYLYRGLYGNNFCSNARNAGIHGWGGIDSSDKSAMKDCVLENLSSGAWFRKRMALFNAYKSVENADIVSLYDSRIEGRREDVIRHLYSQALLCRYYGGSLDARLRFAEEVGDLWERCGNNYQDEMQMDYHNNKVGRNMYKNMISYEERRFWFFGWHYYTIIINPSDVFMLGEATRLAGQAIHVTGKVKSKKLKYVELHNQIIQVKNPKGKYYVDNKYQYYMGEKCTRKHWIWRFADKKEPVKLE